ncbi:MAG: D-alanyl-D-alanine carboxypeptidase [Phaeodactylibacter sp.]|nr:D-alanyl-D-alanine carboxypeptidase [Phaeodactylibacter sp.]MCB9276254.1 D-alanyl-D-alanine carboxypeptidase [Lewinellaceae bacterium]
MRVPTAAFFSFFFFLLFGGTPAFAQPELSKKQQQALAELFQSSELFPKIFTGFALYDPEARLMLYEKDADKYYTPASNTKILTLYTTLQVLGDSIPALRYIQTGDSLIFWGTGNPLFLHPRLPADPAVLAFLKDTTCQLFFSAHNFREQRFGPGWAWDDYNDYYQAERSPFPIYGNLARFERLELEEGFQVFPPYFQQHLAFNPALDNGRPEIRRQEHSNCFEYNHRALSGLPFTAEVPFRTSPQTIAALLSDTLWRAVGLISLPELPARPVSTLYSPIPDTLFRLLMYESDNCLAEQLLLACSEKISGQLQADEAIRYASDSLFQSLPDKLVWRDGSGLSRYNLFTPRDLVGILDMLYRQLPRERLLSFFPAGGVRGTIQEQYKGEKGPYVFAKTGTLSNRHCLSGYLLTDKGRLLIFSFMNSNYVNGTGQVKEEMEKVLRFVRENF